VQAAGPEALLHLARQYQDATAEEDGEFEEEEDDMMG
jgi:hypothetical protein